MSSTTVAPLDRDYLKKIGDGLDEAFAAAPVETLGAEERIVVFSDHHRGAGDGADDFRHCEHAYTAALGYYLAAGYRLFLLGDVEELWEEPPARPLERYADVLDLERQFAAAGRLERFWGNHDDAWASRRTVRRHLEHLIGGGKVREALRLRVPRPDGEDGVLFFVHGHQGTDASDTFGKLARLPVRYLWRPLDASTWSGGLATRAPNHRA